MGLVWECIISVIMADFDYFCKSVSLLLRKVLGLWWLSGWDAFDGECLSFVKSYDKLLIGLCL